MTVTPHQDILRGAFHHLPGIGVQRRRQLAAAGIRDWRQLLEGDLPFACRGAARHRLVEAVLESERLVAADDLPRLVARFGPADQWRILCAYFDRAAFVDIETAGMGADAPITVVAVHEPGDIACYVGDVNLDDALDHLERLPLIATFNGANFDLPFIHRFFHVPSLRASHIDLRWICHHHELRGGLKSIERRLGIDRPDDLAGVDGAEAVWLWSRWQEGRDADALHKLVRYCAADVVTLRAVGARLLSSIGIDTLAPERHPNWDLLDTLTPPAPAPVTAPAMPTPDTDPAYQRLVAHQRRLRHS